VNDVSEGPAHSRGSDKSTDREMRQNRLEELRSVEDLAHHINRRLRRNWSASRSIISPDEATCVSEEALHDDALDGFCPRGLGTTDEGPDLTAEARMQDCLILIAIMTESAVKGSTARLATTA
jgi:hypothetical protein